MDDRLLAEYHAYKEGLQATLKFGNKDVIKETILLIEEQAATSAYYYKTAARKVMRLKLWQRCKSYLEGSLVSVDLS